MKVQNIKNRSFRPFVESEGVQLYFDHGVNPISGILSLLVQAERITSAGKGVYAVNSAYLPEGKTEYKFKANKDANTVPIQTLLDCPTLVDAKDKEDLEEYLKPYMNAIECSRSSDFNEKAISFDEEGNPIDADEDIMSEVAEMEDQSEED
jgi:hypothetical protein